MNSSIQSVAGQPVAAPISMPMHQGASPSDRSSASGPSSHPRFGDFVAGGIEVIFGVPDQALAIETMPDTGTI